MHNVTLITTGGTIEKTYDEATGRLENRRSIVRRMLDGEPQEDDDPLGRLALRERLNAEAPPLGARVFIVNIRPTSSQ
mgnify:CR=1 FL=1